MAYLPQTIVLRELSHDGIPEGIVLAPKLRLKERFQSLDLIGKKIGFKLRRPLFRFKSQTMAISSTVDSQPPLSNQIEFGIRHGGCLES
ncbi:hypothetical protein Bca52824_035085 [Brassica carinata]|uniref:Uncharacterized protein n=1 Tax=Brassica carinata TaxID=52824 RepID=A0A8X7RZZ6_BRACI|nr:hypothetical protein Bca52824_035085 [Brassica carinata]